MQFPKFLDFFIFFILEKLPDSYKLLLLFTQRCKMSMSVANTFQSIPFFRKWKNKISKQLYGRYKIAQINKTYL